MTYGVVSTNSTHVYVCGKPSILSTAEVLHVKINHTKPKPKTRTKTRNGYTAKRVLHIHKGNSSRQ